ncbi:MAG: hypothetical protein QXL17_06525 [Candidatus Thermoplasmatota archaeon]
MDYVETSEEFGETIKRFLRRFETYASKYHIKRPECKSLEEIMNLAKQYGVKPVRAAIIAHALVKSSKSDEIEEMEKNDK